MGPCRTGVPSSGLWLLLHGAGGLQELDYEKSVNYGSALGSEEAPFLPEDRMSMGYYKGIFRVSIDVILLTLGYLKLSNQGN